MTDYRCTECGRWLMPITRRPITLRLCPDHPEATHLSWTKARHWAMDYVQRNPQVVEQMKTFGRDWLRTYYPGATPASLREAYALASRWDLLPSASGPTDTDAATAFWSRPGRRETSLAAASSSVPLT